ncbi:hydantoinase B/oxoprolinase family protein [Mesorhizobium sp.]|uniref:hydantoinase B/oxoprolinase family protein n=1 Tax=Mesorhizobium sp. TaxID=1871066 RepID=UPI000FE39DCF|nr:hydantoinase B/oxoprolinase family protein [Mesorhizobium sp.]RWH95484.1 MAG: hydantoinase B/oxoprolinase family protein [Mesorhizobium sp.]RWK17680.1 MAG: hydantoinase B/oxoprolinase family protein [Mesorhizobium sp.]RWK27586.1 MAG: hydantoinase B/oxoprolinase family protein [Mesorhizobium sp.]RWM21393.1 MAG: hydantoinase B/oxoprolinase family protein [Mesorhizobium sp.]
MTNSTLDPITLELIHNGLKSITYESYVALKKSAYSTNIKERHDHSVTIADPKGRIVVQAEGSFPTHLGSMAATMEIFLQTIPREEIRDGDIFISNDPHTTGGSHLPDVNLMMPVFREGELICFICNLAHHADIGGMSPGSMDGSMTEIFQEGLRIPLIKLFDKGQLNQPLMDLILLNVRVPEERRGDYFAQVAACKLGYRRMAEHLAAYPRDLTLAAFDEIVERTHRRMQTAIASVPDGTYSFDDVMDDDGVGTKDIPISLKIAVSGDEMVLDFTGTSPQVRGNINCPRNATIGAVAYVLKALLDPNIPNNHGTQSAFTVITEGGSLVDARFPAAVASRNHTCQRLCDMVIGALAPALPDRVVAAANGSNTSIAIAGVDPRTGKPYIYFETLGGGFGARASKDGSDAVQVHMTNTSNSPIEALELEYPLLVEEYSLRENSGGAGRYRGGLGLRRVIRPLGHTASFNVVGERFVHAPWGIFEGQSGAPGVFSILCDEKGEIALPGKVPTRPLAPHQSISVQTPGAGGYGDPARRAPEARAEDLESGKFSPSAVA